MVQNSMEMVEDVCVFGFHLEIHFLSIWQISQFQCSGEASRNSRTRGRASGNRIMVVPAPYIVPTENLNTSPK